VAVGEIGLLLHRILRLGFRFFAFAVLADLMPLCFFDAGRQFLLPSTLFKAACHGAPTVSRSGFPATAPHLGGIPPVSNHPTDPSEFSARRPAILADCFGSESTMWIPTRPTVTWMNTRLPVTPSAHRSGEDNGSGGGVQ
jgi:hypothetical protein